MDNELLSGGYHFENLGKKNIKLEKKNVQLLKYKKKLLSKSKLSWIGGNNYITRKIKRSELYNPKLHKVFTVYNTIESLNFLKKKFKILNQKII